jgi:uncharacterized protein (DUF1697 family)
LGTIYIQRMASSLALLRGINVGGNTLIKMAELRDALDAAGFEDVRTYINSGNVIFKSAEGNPAPRVGQVITDTFGHEVDVVCFTDKQWTAIADDAPSWWGKDEKWRHNLFALLDAGEMDAVVEAIGELRPGLEMIAPGHGVLYQSVDPTAHGRAATGSKLAGRAVYKRMTVRNRNTTLKLAALLGSAG